MSTEIEKRQEPRDLTLIDVIASAARDPNVDVAKMERLLDIKRQIEKDQAQAEFKAAMARVQASVPRIDKHGKIVVPGKEGRTGHQTPYALYQDIDSGLRPLLQEEGFAVSYTCESSAKGEIWKCIVSHRAGHQETYVGPPFPADQTGSKNAAQALVSASSYARRNLTTMVWNIITVGVDDDARATGFVNDSQIMTITDMLTDIGAKPGSKRLADFLAYAEADAVAHIQKYRYDSCVAMLRKAVAQKDGRA